MITILHLIHRYRGDYPLLNQQVKLDPARYRTVICYLSGEDDGKNQLVADGYQVIYLGESGKKLRFHNLSLILKLKKILEDSGCQVVNCQQHRSTPLGVLASLVASNRPAVISTLHGLGTARTLRRKFLNYFLYKKLFKIIGISHGVSEDILQSNWNLGRQKVATVQNGLVYDSFLNGRPRAVERRAILPEATETFWFGTAGRLSEVKNHRNLLLAFEKVVRAHPECLLLIAGDGKLEASLKESALSLGISERVAFLGFRRDIPSILRSLDVFLLPSLREGFGLALLEAMSTGLPAIASKVGGIPEIFENTDMGVLIDPADPEALAAAMIDMVNCKAERREKMGENAKRRALEDFSADRMIRDYERVYDEAYAFWSEKKQDN